MLRISYICLLILAICLSWVVYRLRLRKVTRAIRVARELYDTMLQTVHACKFVADDALENSTDITHLRLAMEKLSNWLGQATREGQKGLKSLTANVEKHDD